MKKCTNILGAAAELLVSVNEEIEWLVPESLNNVIKKIVVPFLNDLSSEFESRS